MSGHFLSLLDLQSEPLWRLVRRAIELRVGGCDASYEPLRNRMVALLFEQPSTRTRLSFEAAVTRMGGNPVFLSARDMQLHRGEPLEDTARVLSRMADAVVIRARRHETLETVAAHSTVPVINALSDLYHPCQLLADIQTWVERHGDLDGRRAAWVGDGNNVCHSWINAARQFGFDLCIATPPGYGPRPGIVAAAGARVRLCESPQQAVSGCDLVVTDTWASMNMEDEREERLRAFDGYRITTALMECAAKDALFMHCLPAYREVEVDSAVIDGPQSVVWDEAENRLHAQQALLEHLCCRGGAQ